MSYSYDRDLVIWVGDLDDYVDLNAIMRANEQEERELQLQRDLAEIGDIPLLSGKSASSRKLNARGTPPSEWRWATHQATQALRDYQGAEVERAFLRALLSLGRSYAINAFADWERVSRASAVTATLPLGFRALLDQYLVGEGIQLDFHCRKRVRETLKEADDASLATAYRRAAMVQALVHELADYHSPFDRLKLHRERTRSILALARLRFSTRELDLDSFAELQALVDRYEADRTVERSGTEELSIVTGRRIRNWRLRHLHSLIFFYPYSIRHALARGLRHMAETSQPPDRTLAINELALAHCNIEQMRLNARRVSQSP